MESKNRDFFLVLIGMIYITIFFSSFVMGYKTVKLFNHTFCASIFVFPLLFPINDSISEILGKKTSYYMIIFTVFCEILFTSVTYFLASLPSPENFPNQEIYKTLTSGFYHIIIANSIALTLGFFSNTYFLNKWGKKFYGKNFFIRSLAATGIGEIIFTVITNFIAFYFFNKTSILNTIDIILSDYLFKFVYSFFICIPNALLVNKIKNIINNKSLLAKRENNNNVIDFLNKKREKLLNF